MGDYRRNYVPAFGSWDWNDGVSFTQCFESPRQARFVPYRFSEDRDLYVTGDLYENEVVTPAMIVVPRSRTKRHSQRKGVKKQIWAADRMESPGSPPPPPRRKAPKPVDEDLYKISPELLNAKTRKRGGMCIFASCFLPNCDA